MTVTMKRKLANVVVVINWILFAFFVLSYIIAIAVSLIFFDAVAKWVTEQVQMESKEDLNEEEVLKTARYVLTIALVIIGILGLVGIIIQLALNLLLTKGVNQSDRRKCNIWLVINLILFILGALGLVIKLFKVINGVSSVVSLLVDLIFLAWLGISLFIIKNLRDDLGGNVSYGGVVYAKADSNPAV